MCVCVCLKMRQRASDATFREEITRPIPDSIQKKNSSDYCVLISLSRLLSKFDWMITANVHVWNKQRLPRRLHFLTGLGFFLLLTRSFVCYADCRLWRVAKTERKRENDKCAEMEWCEEDSNASYFSTF